MASRQDSVAVTKAAPIKIAERDRELGLDGETWPARIPDGWTWDGQALTRTIAANEAQRVPAALQESILRFPSAPVHGMHRLHEHHMKLGSSESFHSMRILRSADRKHHGDPVTRIFLMNTGLNERTTMELYYWLASLLVQQEPGTVCVVRPFPGHLTRYPFQGLAETPLDSYLWDGSHLFRQFLRYMLETQWFLSAIVRRSSYRCASGANLLAESDDLEHSRLDGEVLAQEMRDRWMALCEASRHTVDLETPENQPDRPPLSDPPPEKAFRDSIDALRDVLNLERDYKRHTGVPKSTRTPVEPKIHVIGYSLGGFTAQSVFMSWPFLISSCSTVLAGGPLRELAPTGFADPEEWQTVLHSLRYELDDRLISGHLGVDEHQVAGIERELFSYLKRTFYDVFQQEYRGSIQSRYEAFRSRMLFIVGGNDPVVRPETVLRSAPKGGLNLLEIGGLSHFLTGAGGDRAEQAQREFWLPEMATLIDRFAKNAAAEHDRQQPLSWFDSELAKPDLSREEWQAALELQKGHRKSKGDGSAPVNALAPSELIRIGADGSLLGELFERCLDDLLHRTITGEGGMLFILRNELPTVMLHDSAIREAAASLYHDDFNIVRYCHGVEARREVIDEHIDHMCMVLPYNARSILRRLDLQPGFPSQAESAGGGVKVRMDPDAAWAYCENRCRTLTRKPGGRYSVRSFDGNQRITGRERDLVKLLTLAKEYTGREEFKQIPSMPDCWIWVARGLLAHTAVKIKTQEAIHAIVPVAREVGADTQTMLQAIRDERIRIVTVSRARFNPRFRGRLIVDGRAARKVLLHAALCVAQSKSVHGQQLDQVFS
jgi:pimeloyl-ACP methyl ester carboxylesterase